MHRKCTFDTMNRELCRHELEKNKTVIQIGKFHFFSIKMVWNERYNVLDHLWTCPFELVSPCFNRATSPPAQLPTGVWGACTHQPRLEEDRVPSGTPPYCININGKNPYPPLQPYPPKISNRQRQWPVWWSTVPTSIGTMPILTNNWHRWPSSHGSKTL